MHNWQDDDYCDLLKGKQRQELVGSVWSYALALENYVVNLRGQVNAMAARQGLRSPYPDLESDFRIRYFRDYPAFNEFKEVLETEETDLVLPD